MFKELMRKRRNIFKYLDGIDDAWLVDTQRELIECINKRDLRTAATYCEVISVYYVNYALEKFDRFDSSLVKWREFSLGMEYLRVSKIVEKKNRMFQEPVYLSLARDIGAIFWGFICNRDDFLSLFLPALKFQKISFPPEIHFVEQLINDALSGDLGLNNYSFYDFLVKGESDQEKLSICISEHVKMSKYTKKTMPCFVLPFDMIPIEILFCMQFSQLKLNNELDNFLASIAACKYESDSIIEMIDIEL